MLKRGPIWWFAPVCGAPIARVRVESCSPSPRWLLDNRRRRRLQWPPGQAFPNLAQQRRRTPALSLAPETSPPSRATSNCPARLLLPFPLPRCCAIKPSSHPTIQPSSHPATQQTGQPTTICPSATDTTSGRPKAPAGHSAHERRAAEDA